MLEKRKKKPIFGQFSYKYKDDGLVVSVVTLIRRE